MTSAPAPATREAVPAKGIATALGAFGLWGLSPLYWKLLAHVSPLEVLAQRLLWSFLFVSALMARQRRFAAVFAALRGRRVLLGLLLSTALISVNWFSFIWAVANDRVLETSMGYFINPLVSVALGFVILQERMNRAQWIAVGLAATGVAVMIIGAGTVPWLSLLLAGTFGVYGLVRKVIPVSALEGLFAETLACLPLAVLFVGYLAWSGEGAFGETWGTSLLLVVAGPVTAVPLLFFAMAARQLPLATLGLTQYVAPSTQFALAVFLWGEPFTLTHLVTFGCIWAGLAVYSANLLRRT